MAKRGINKQLEFKDCVIKQRTLFEHYYHNSIRNSSEIAHCTGISKRTAAHYMGN